MKISALGARKIVSFEGVRVFPYSDKTGAPLNEWNSSATIGVGHLILENEWQAYRRGIDTYAAIFLFIKDIERFERCVSDSVTVPLKQHEYDALVSLCFNIGCRNFAQSTLVRHINTMKNSYLTIESAWSAWNKADGKVVQGLINRRKSEYSLYKTGVYDV